MIDPHLEGKTAIVTGANHGIGAATAKALAAQGINVFVTYLRLPEGGVDTVPDQPGPERHHALQATPGFEVVKTIHDSGGKADGWDVDLAEPGSIPALFDRAEAAFGRVEIVVNNAAHCERDTFVPSKTSDGVRTSTGGYPLTTISASSHDEHFAINSRAPALVMAEYARRHMEQAANWGRVINVSTDAASGAPDEVSYWASKHALESFSRGAARELGPYGITVNVVAPGPVQTGWMNRELTEEAAANTPLGRVGQPEDVADVIVFLASEQGRWLTGQLLYVGGGHRMPQ